MENIPAGTTACVAIYDSSNRMLQAQLVESEFGSVAWEETNVQVKVFLLNSQMQSVSLPWSECRYDGAVVTTADQTIRLNGEDYPCHAADSYMVDDETKPIKYDDALHGGLVSVHNVCIWDEDNGEEKRKIHVAIGES